ncbi:hypothetical protein [Microcoleus sp. bin38.metabat.b11b12b14.051]|nr:hypothetical protein [Microcoleus sp. bin38.metabat.b11b12b14.051]
MLIRLNIESQEYFFRAKLAPETITNILNLQQPLVVGIDEAKKA